MGDIPVTVSPDFSWQMLLGNPATEVTSDLQGDLLRGISKLLTQPRGKVQAAIHFLAPGNPSSVQQTCSSAGLDLMLFWGGAAWGHLYMMEACSSLFNWR